MKCDPEKKGLICFPSHAKTCFYLLSDPPKPRLVTYWFRLSSVKEHMIISVIYLQRINRRPEKKTHAYVIWIMEVESAMFKKTGYYVVYVSNICVKQWRHWIQSKCQELSHFLLPSVWNCSHQGVVVTVYHRHPSKVEWPKLGKQHFGHVSIHLMSALSSPNTSLH